MCNNNRGKKSVKTEREKSKETFGEQGKKKRRQQREEWRMRKKRFNKDGK